MKSISKFSIHQVIQRPLGSAKGTVKAGDAFDDAPEDEFLYEYGQ
jgi:hypothetical protein